jgi:GT2 family glycosyltransferase
VIDRVGLFDPRYFLYYEEIDHCRAVRRDGWSVVYYPFTQVVHIGGESAASEGPLVPKSRQISTLRTESELLYFRKQYGSLGLVASVALTFIADLFIACKSLVLHLKPDRAAAAVEHTLTVFNVLLATRLASRATR